MPGEGTLNCHAELRLPHPESDPIVLDCDPTSAECKCTQIRIGPSECKRWLQRRIPPVPFEAESSERKKIVLGDRTGIKLEIVSDGVSKAG